MTRRFGLKTVCVLIGFWLLAPIFIVIPLSFTAHPSFVFPPTEYSTRWYTRFLTDPAWVNDTYHSLIIALASALIATIIGTCAALGARLMPKTVRAAISVVVLIPLMVPGVFLAIADYFTFLELGIVGTYQGFIVANVVLALPLVYVPVSASLENFDRRLELAASSLGANRWTTFRSVTLPLIVPGLLAGAAFALVSAWDEVLIALFISSPGLSTLPVRLYVSVANSTDPTLAAVSSLTILVVALIVGAVALRRLAQLRSTRAA